MADGTKIEWTDATWQIVTGCDVVSPGCTNCYAMRLAGTRLRNHASRRDLTTMTKKGPVWNGQVRFNVQWLEQPLRWQKPRDIFVAAHGDLFHDAVQRWMLVKVFAVMAIAKRHRFQVLTKRADNMRAFCTWLQTVEGRSELEKAARELGHTFEFEGRSLLGLPLPNVWLGVSVEDQQRADERIPLLLDTPAAVRWISAEPLLGPLDLARMAYGPGVINGLIGYADGTNGRGGAQTKLDWVVAGGESGPNARPSHPGWFVSLRDQCAAAGTAFFFKQHGAWADYRQLGATEWTFIEERDGKRYGFIADDKKGLLGGKLFETRYPWTDETEVGPGPCMVRVGKGNAGATLDGREHKELPR